MPTLQLPILRQDRRGTAAATAAAEEDASPFAVDRSKPYPSCAWIEGGIAFNRRSLNACLIVHHNGRGFPHLLDYNGGPIDVNAIRAGRARIIRENQGGGHEACRGCQHLETRLWPGPRFTISVMGIAQFSRCNIQCNYCYLQTQDPSLFAAGFDPYKVMPALEALARDGHLDPHLIADWGGGEPTIYPEFDAALEFLTRRGATTWVHTNGTRLPRPIANGLPTKRVHILCSVDAGTRETWEAIKGRDLLETVWRNLERYIRSGCRVQLKYIMKEENCSPGELHKFVRRAIGAGARELVLDIDYDYPNPSRRVLRGLRMLKDLATLRGMHVVFGSTGAYYTPEVDVAGELEQTGRGRLPGAKLFLRVCEAVARILWVVRMNLRTLRRR